MKLIGQYDSPFVRRVAVALLIYEIVYDHVPWSTFGDGDLVARHNPLKRVPALVLDDGEVLIESGAILDYLDERVGPDRALLPLSGAARRAALRRIALMTGAAGSLLLLRETLFRGACSRLCIPLRRADPHSAGSNRS